MDGIRSFNALSPARQQLLIRFFEAHKGPRMAKSEQEILQMMTLADLDHGGRFFSLWDHETPLACLGLILAQLEQKREIYLPFAALTPTPDSITAFRALIQHCNTLAQEASPYAFRSRLGIGPRLDFAAEAVETLGYRLHETMLTLELPLPDSPPAFPAARLTPQPLTQENLLEFLEIHNRSFAHVPNGSQTTAEALMEWLQEPSAGETRGVLTHSGKAVAFYELSHSPGSCTRLIEAIGVSPELQGQGYGREALQTCVAMLRQQGATAAQLLVMDSNRKALKLYLNFGFTEKDIYNHWYQLEVPHLPSGGDR